MNEIKKEKLKCIDKIKETYRSLFKNKNNKN